MQKEMNTKLLTIKYKNMKTSRIKNVVSVKPHTNNYGTTYYHNLEMENGDKNNKQDKQDVINIQAERNKLQNEKNKITNF